MDGGEAHQAAAALRRSPFILSRSCFSGAPVQVKGLMRVPLQTKWSNEDCLCLSRPNDWMRSAFVGQMV
eukprot:1105942-Pelagomonas_calceolata.AAC.2